MHPSFIFTNSSRWGHRPNGRPLHFSVSPSVEAKYSTKAANKMPEDTAPVWVRAVRPIGDSTPLHKELCHECLVCPSGLDTFYSSSS